jgi:hypothetical protein
MNDTTTTKLYDAVFEQYALLARAIVNDNLLDLADVKAERDLFKPKKINLDTYNPNRGHCSYAIGKRLEIYLRDIRSVSPELLDERVTITVDGFTCAFIREHMFECKARLEELIPASKRRHIVTEPTHGR